MPRPLWLSRMGILDLVVEHLREVFDERNKPRVAGESAKPSQPRRIPRRESSSSRAVGNRAPFRCPITGAECRGVDCREWCKGCVE